MPAEVRQEDARCVIAGGGPAGVMLGYLLARAGVPVVVLEKHADFFRDFRGDTVHPSTLHVMAELGLLERFLRRPHQELHHIEGHFGDETLRVADFSAAPEGCRFVAFMPQWDFLDFLAEEGRALPEFRLIMQARAERLIENGGRVAGVVADVAGEMVEISGDLVVGCDGRDSAVRALAGLPVRDLGAPIDVLWMRLSRRPSDPDAALGRLNRGHFLVTIDRGDYWQCAFIIPKGDFDDIRARGLAAFQEELAQVAPFIEDRVGELVDWEQVKLLTVQVNRLERWWRPGLLCIGDAAHAMSPVGGIGINLAVQDAVAAANRLAAPLAQGRLSDGDLAAIQDRRERPTRRTQAVQVFVQDRLIGPMLGRDQSTKAPLPARVIGRLPALQRMMGRLIGMGALPESVDPRITGADG